MKKHKQIKKQKQRFIKIGAKTYEVLKDLKLKVKLVHVESKFNTPIVDPEPFEIDVSKLNIEHLEKRPDEKS